MHSLLLRFGLNLSMSMIILEARNAMSLYIMFQFLNKREKLMLYRRFILSVQARNAGCIKNIKRNARKPLSWLTIKGVRWSASIVSEFKFTSKSNSNLSVKFHIKVQISKVFSWISRKLKLSGDYMYRKNIRNHRNQWDEPLSIF